MVKQKSKFFFFIRLLKNTKNECFVRRFNMIWILLTRAQNWRIQNLISKSTNQSFFQLLWSPSHFMAQCQKNHFCAGSPQLFQIITIIIYRNFKTKQTDSLFSARFIPTPFQFIERSLGPTLRFTWKRKWMQMCHLSNLLDSFQRHVYGSPIFFALFLSDSDRDGQIILLNLWCIFLCVLNGFFFLG